MKEVSVTVIVPDEEVEAVKASLEALAATLGPFQSEVEEFPTARRNNARIGRNNDRVLG